VDKGVIIFKELLEEGVDIVGKVNNYTRGYFKESGYKVD
jgi:hypothetical protein